MKKNILLLFFCIISGSSFGQNLRYFFGNIHAHTAFSDGNKDHKAQTPAECFQFAKQSEHMDFLGISEHNHSQAGMHLQDYAKGIEQANEENEDGNFVCLYGMEFGVIMNGGHVLIYGIDSLMGWEDDNFDIFCDKFDYTSLWNILVARPTAFATLAHPADKDFGNLAHKKYNAIADEAIYGMAIRTGPAFSTATNFSDKPPGSFNSYYRLMLAAGYKLGPGIDHDTHNTVFGRNTQRRTVILAPSLTRENIIEAYKAMRFYASDDWNTEVTFTIGGEPMGSMLTTEDDVDIEVSVEDADNDDKTKSIKLFFGKSGSKKLATNLKTVSNKNSFEFTHTLTKKGNFYYYLEITQQDGDKIFTSPIWVEKE
jgi:hypothetical protein